MVPADALKECVIPTQSSLRDALASLDRSACKVVVAVDQHLQVVGLLTDGDLRRAMLAGAALDDAVLPHVRRSFTSVNASASRADVLDLMHARRIAEVPILDAAGRLIGLHLLHDIVARNRRKNWAVVMAGGKGTRLGSLTESTPKPMLRVAGRPILERIVLHLAGAGVERIFLAVNYLGHVIEDHFGDGSRFGCKIEYLREDAPLGTAGALAMLPSPPTESLVVMNGDLVTQVDLGDLLEFHERGGQSATVGIKRYLHTVPFGCFELDGDLVTKMEEKPTITKIVNAGMYVLSARAAARVAQPRELTMPDLLASLLADQERVVAYEIVDDWIDVGRKDELQKARGGQQ